MLAGQDVTKLAATAFLFLVAVFALVVMGYDLVVGRAIPELILNVVSLAVGAAASLIGVHIGGQQVAQGIRAQTEASSRQEGIKGPP